MMYRFECGCEFPVTGPPPRPGAPPLIDIDPDHLPDCKAAWAIYATGRTKGLFQVEGGTGRKWSPILKPESIEHLGALLAVIRPGCLEVQMEDGMTVTEKYCRRKNGLEAPTPFHPALEEVLRKTYGLMLYQEQMTKIAEVLAGFDLVEQDMLRKAAGKKDMAAMDKVGLLFVEKAVAKRLVGKQEAETIFSNIRKSGRYLFNKSHSISYAKKSYQTAYLKTHILGWFFASWLKNAQDAADSQEEVLELVENARQYELEVLVPDVRTLSTTISSDGLSVRFGLADVKGVGPSQPQKLSEAFPDGFGGWTWPDFLYRAADTVASTAMRAWVGAGAFDWTGVTRTRMGKEFDAWLELTDIEKEWVRSKAPGTTLVEALKSLGRTRKEGGGCSNHKRADLVRSLALMLENQASSDADHPNLLCAMEESYLGVALTCSRVDGCDVSSANVTCGEFLAGKAGHLMLACEVKDVRIIRTKKDGREMAFVTVADRTASLPDVVVFPDTWAKFGRLFRAKNTVLLEGERDYKKGVSFIVNRAIQL